MAASIAFLAGGFGFPINNLNGSGLGFYGVGGFGASVPVAAYQDTTFITDGNGINQGPQVNNVKWIHPLSGQLPGAVNLLLQKIPNYQGTLNIRFSNSSAVRTQNAQLYIYDRTNLSNAASGVVTAVCPLIHPDLSQTVTGSGGSVWQFPAGSSYVPMSVMNNGTLFSPGMSGYSPNGGSTIDVQHDFYAAISASPSTVGAKTQFALQFQTEYL